MRLKYRVRKIFFQNNFFISTDVLIFVITITKNETKNPQGIIYKRNEKDIVITLTKSLQLEFTTRYWPGLIWSMMI